jgi:hypothetical protein
MGLLNKKQQLPARRSSASGRSARAAASDLDERYAFRRNRTLTGSLVSSVPSANENRSELKSTRVHAHGLRRHRRKLSALLVGIVAVAVGLLALIYQMTAIVHVASGTPKGIDHSVYESKIQDYLTIHPLERFRFSVNADTLTSYLQKNGCPEIFHVASDARFDGLGTTKFMLEFRQPAVSWSTGSSQLYVDESGAAFTRNYFPDPAVKVIDQTGIETKNNQVLASSRFLGFVGMVIGKMKQYDLVVTSVVLPASTTRQIAVNVKGFSYPIKLSVDRPVGEQVEDASRAIRYLANKGITPQYLDVRVGGRAFYK